MFNRFSEQIAIDLGTANTLVAIKGQGIVLEEPSVVAINPQTKEVLAVGSEAKKMLGRAPNGIEVLRPLRDGSVHDFDTTEVMIRYLLTKSKELYITPWRILKPQVLIGVPTSATEVEVNAVKDAARLAGAGKVYILQEPFAVHKSVNLKSMLSAKGRMVIDIGGGTTDIAVMSMGGIVVDHTIKIAGDEINQEVVDHLRNKYNMLIGENMAEEIKVTLGRIGRSKSSKGHVVRGRDIISGLPKTLEITGQEIEETILKVLSRIIPHIESAIEATPPELLADILLDGIYLAGGGALIPGLGSYLSDRLNVKIRIVPDPLSAVVRGLAALLDDLSLLNKLQLTETSFL